MVFWKNFSKKVDFEKKYQPVGKEIILGLNLNNQLAREIVAKDPYQAESFIQAIRILGRNINCVCGTPCPNHILVHNDGLPQSGSAVAQW